ncbi:hypothetical protein KAR91_27450 [Candidatus Pacearchaeota archaeon]|nr:hypothetical protein [Candidatus Pacearchaeota archaeon]
MNKEYITKFLATEVRRAGNSNITITNLQVHIINHARRGELEGFRPLNKISHAFKVQDAIAKMGENVQLIYSRKLCNIIDGVEMFSSEVENEDIFYIANATAEQRAIAAFRALASEKQIKEGGL